MAGVTKKTKSATRCTYCLKPLATPMSDNIFGQTWQGETSNEKLIRWQVPTCIDCLNRFEKIEHDFLIRIGELFAPIELQLIGIPKDVTEFINAKTEDTKKGIHEKSTPDEILFRQIVRGANIDPELIRKAKENFDYQPIINIKRLTAKFIRGLFYSVNSRIIEKDHTLEIFFKHEVDPKPINEAIESVVCQTICGKGIKITASFAEDDLQSGIFNIKIWDHLELFAFSR